MDTKKLRTSLVCSAALVQLLTIFPCRADWEYTRWGMTVKEVQGASGGKAVPVSSAKQPANSNGQKTLLETRWSLDGYTFDVLFNFTGDEPRLTEVVLIPQGNIENLGAELSQKYGPPTKTQGGLTQTKAPGFSLVQRTENYSATSGRGDEVWYNRLDSPDLNVLLEWKTPTDFIQYKRQSATEAVLRFQPASASKSSRADSTYPLAHTQFGTQSP